MKKFIIIAMNLCACAVRDPVQMKQMPMRLIAIDAKECASGNRVILTWESLDGKIKIETREPLEDSNAYRTGMIFSRCFLPR